MVAISQTFDSFYRGDDHQIPLRYQPPAGVSREGMEITAVLIPSKGVRLPASSITFDPATGDIVATWTKVQTAALASDLQAEVRFSCSIEGISRVFYTRKVQIL